MYKETKLKSANAFYGYCHSNKVVKTKTTKKEVFTTAATTTTTKGFVNSTFTS